MATYTDVYIADQEKDISSIDCNRGSIEYLIDFQWKFLITLIFFFINKQNISHIKSELNPHFHFPMAVSLIN